MLLKSDKDIGHCERRLIRFTLLSATRSVTSERQRLHRNILNIGIVDSERHMLRKNAQGRIIFFISMARIIFFISMAKCLITFAILSAAEVLLVTRTGQYVTL
jgi:hypothetical protein